MFDSSFSHSSAAPIPPNLSIENAVSLLHDFEATIKLSPDTRDCRPIPPKNGHTKAHDKTNGTASADGIQYFEVEDDLPFIPKKLWSGGVKYRADFVPVADGSDITVHAPGGFTSTNHWRLVRNHVPEDGESRLEPPQSKDMLHADTAGSGWYVQIISDASCNKTFAPFVKAFLSNVHSSLQHNFIEKLGETPQQQKQERSNTRRRKSSVL